MNALNSRRSRASLGLALTTAGLLLIPAFPAAASQDLTLRFGSPTRTVIDLGSPGATVGDITVTSGQVSSSKSVRKSGSYSTNQITVQMDVPANRETRKVDLSIDLNDGEIFATGLIVADIGSPPAKKQHFAITGGTGAYAGISGTILHDAVAGKTSFTVVVKPLQSR